MYHIQHIIYIHNIPSIAASQKLKFKEGVNVFNGLSYQQFILACFDLIHSSLKQNLMFEMKKVAFLIVSLFFNYLYLLHLLIICEPIINRFSTLQITS